MSSASHGSGRTPPASWSAQERDLWAHFRRGTELDLADHGGGRDPAQNGDWPGNRNIAAAVVAKLLLDGPEAASGCVATVRLRGARVIGQLALDGAVIRHQIELTDCYFDEPLLLRGACTRRLSLAGSWLPQLRLHNIDVDGELALERIRTFGLVDLADATVARSVRLMDATLSGEHGPALMGERMRTGGALLCQGLTASGEIRLPGARIGGIINLASASLRSSRGTALDGNGLSVGGSFFADRRRGATLGMRTVGRVFLAGARIEGDLDLSGAELALSPDGLTAGSRGLPASASGPGTDADTDPTAVLVAERATIDGNLEIDEGFTSHGTIRVASAVIKGDIRASECTIKPDQAPDRQERFAVVADGLDLGGELLCRPGFAAHGEVLVRTARIGGNVFLDGARLLHPYLNALNLDRTTIQGNLSARRLVAEGTVRMQNATVGGSVVLAGASLTRAYETVRPGSAGDGPEVTIRPSLDARAAQIARDFQCQADGALPFTAAAGVRLRGADVRKSVTFQSAVLESSGGAYALNLFGLRSTELVLAVGAPPDGLVELSQVHATAVYDNAHLWAAVQGVRLEDFEYDGITAAEGHRRAQTLPGTDLPDDAADAPVLTKPLPIVGEPSVRGRVQWLQAGLDASSGYTPQPYEQLAACYRADGHDRDARYVLLAKQRHRRRTLGAAGRFIGRLLDLTVGYGYRTWLALVWLGGLWILGYLYLRTLDPSPIDADVVGAHWSPGLFTLDLLLPIIGFEQEGVFAMSGADRWVAAGLELAGWLLATAVLAGLTRALQRGD